MRASVVLSGVAAGVRRNATMTIALILSTSIALAFVGAALLANTEISKFTRVYEGKINVSVYLCATNSRDTQIKAAADEVAAGRVPAPVTCAANAVTTRAQTDVIRARLRSDSAVKSASYVSVTEQYNRARQILSPAQSDILKIGDLPASFTVKLNNINKEYPAFAAKYAAMRGVGAVNNQYQTIKTLLDVLDGARWFSVIIALVVLIASTLLIANTIQVAASQRKNETSIMRLVGASRWMTELPFMLEAVIAAAIGGVISVGLIWIGKHYVLDGVFKVPTQNGVIPNLSVNDVLVAGGTGVIVGIVLSAITAFATLRLYVRL